MTAAIALSGSASLQPVIAWAQAGGGSRPGGDLVRMARLLYPHEALSDDIYAEVLGDAIARTAAEFADSLNELADALDSQTGGDFLAAGETEQITAMRTIENEPLFGVVRAKVRESLYLHPACWEVVGYGGPSFQDGGYLHRGAGEIDWLPEGD